MKLEKENPEKIVTVTFPSNIPWLSAKRIELREEALIEWNLEGLKMDSTK